MIIFAESELEHYPFSILHCQWEIRTGYYKLFERNLQALREKKAFFIGRQLHVQSFAARFPIVLSHHQGDYIIPIATDNYLPNNLILRGDTYFSNESLECFRRARREAGGCMMFTDDNGYPVALILTPDISVSHIFEQSPCFEQIALHYAHIVDRTIDIEADILTSLWCSLDCCGNAIREDEQLLSTLTQYIGDTQKGIFTEGKVFVGSNVRISPHVVLDASKGPILIGDNVTIMAHATIIGPCAISHNSIVKIGAKIYENTAIGEMCKIGGEIENSIIHGYSNKQHEGFLGHSYISEWVNLGADTNTSDLKNTYAPIDITLRGKKVSTQRLFLGSLIGDHSKTAIDTALNTGLAIGIHAQIATTGAIRKEVPSFSFVTPTGNATFQYDKALEIASIVMKRRNKELCKDEIELMKQEYSLYHEKP